MRVPLAVSVAAGVVLLVVACSRTDEAFESGNDDLTSSKSASCSTPLDRKLATTAASVDGRKSQHRCYHFVKQHLHAVGISTAALDASGSGTSAYQFAVWAKKYPDALAKMGFARSSTKASSPPRGSILVWPRGVCSYSKAHGHIEIVIDDSGSRACSDFCGKVRKGCGAPDVFVPKGCASDSAGDTTADGQDIEAPELDDDADAGSAGTAPEDEPATSED